MDDSKGNGLLNSPFGKSYAAFLDISAKKHSKDENIVLNSLRQQTRTREYFNKDRNFHDFFWMRSKHDTIVRPELVNSLQFQCRAVYLCALAMQLGIAIEKEDMDVLRKILDIYKFHEPVAREQMVKALNNYKSDGGQRWDFGDGMRIPPFFLIRGEGY